MAECDESAIGHLSPSMTKQTVCIVIPMRGNRCASAGVSESDKRHVPYHTSTLDGDVIAVELYNPWSTRDSFAVGLGTKHPVSSMIEMHVHNKILVPYIAHTQSSNPFTVYRPAKDPGLD